MPAPPADMLVNIDDESTPDGTKETVEECLNSAGFHTFWDVGLNVRPFEQTAENESLLDEAIDQIQAELPEADIIQREGTNKDSGNSVTYSHHLTIRGETGSNTDSWEDTGSESDPPWRRSDDRANLVATPGSDEGDPADSKEGTQQDESVCPECEAVDTLLINNDEIRCTDCQSVICDTCPECDSTALVADSNRDELICQECGLVVVGCDDI